jgi:hypothetical protein
MKKIITIADEKYIFSFHLKNELNPNSPIQELSEALNEC